MHSFQALFASSLISSSFSLVAAASSSAQIPSKPERAEICTTVLNLHLGLGLDPKDIDCSAKSAKFYVGISEEGDDGVPGYREFSVILNRKAETVICKVYQDNGNSPFEVEGCTVFKAPETCAESVSLATAKALVKKYPSIAHSFFIETPELVSTKQNSLSYSVISSDEVESEKWSVKALGTEQNCKVTKVAITSAGQ